MKRYIIIGIIFLLILVAYLLISSINETMAYYLTVSEFLKENPEIGCRINGIVVPNTIKHKEGTSNYNFKITDGRNELAVTYTGSVSNIFKEGIEVVIEGKYDKEKKIFVATNIITKCPSKYESKQADK